MKDGEEKDRQWQDVLTPEQFHVCRMGGTERPFTGALLDNHEPGTYHCVCCGAALFDADHKFDSGTGWPSFWDQHGDARIRRIEDRSHGMRRVEVRCGQCDAHLGHVFPDGPPPTRLRYCINSVALRFARADA